MPIDRMCTRRPGRAARRGLTDPRALSALMVVGMLAVLVFGALAWAKWFAPPAPVAAPPPPLRALVRVVGEKNVFLGRHAFSADEPTRVEHGFVLHNDGDVPVVVEELAFGCPCLTSEQADDQPIGVIPPGGEWTARVTMTVERVGRHGADVYLLTSDGAATTLRLSAEGVAADGATDG